VRRAAIGLALAALALGACGRKSAPMAPELVRPETPTDLAAVVTPEGVRLSWIRPLRYSGGERMNDLGGFDIERVSEDGPPADFSKIGTLPLDDQTRFKKERRLDWTDETVEPGGRYLYRVIAFTLDGYRSQAAGPVAVRYGPKPGGAEAP
jgi:hypothetical protein